MGTQFQFVHSFVMNFIFASVFAIYFSCVFSIEIDQNIENDSQQPEPPRNTDLYGPPLEKPFPSEGLLVAAKLGHLQSIQHMIEAGADINTISLYNGNTPLIVAAENGQAAIVEYLIKNKADLNAQNNDGKSPIVIAKENGHETVVKQLMDHGATFPTFSAV